MKLSNYSLTYAREFAAKRMDVFAFLSLCRQFGMDNIDTLWDHMAEIEAGQTPPAELAERLNTYFDLVRTASAADREPGGLADPTSEEIRERSMARWISAALRVLLQIRAQLRQVVGAVLGRRAGQALHDVRGRSGVAAQEPAAQTHRVRHRHRLGRAHHR